jgi:hypothetical protein
MYKLANIMDIRIQALTLHYRKYDHVNKYCWHIEVDNKAATQLPAKLALFSI